MRLKITTRFSFSFSELSDLIAASKNRKKLKFNGKVEKHT